MRVHHIALRTNDLERLASFYEQILGLRRVREQNHSLWLACGESVLMIEQAHASEPAVPSGSMEMFSFGMSVEQRMNLRSRLKARGLELERETDHTSYLRDPDGRRVGFSSAPLEKWLTPDQ